MADYFKIACGIVNAHAEQVRKGADDDLSDLDAHDRALIDAAWEKHKAAAAPETAAESTAKALMSRLDRIRLECLANISGAEEDKSRDTLLTEIIRIAEGV